MGNEASKGAKKGGEATPSSANRRVPNENVEGEEEDMEHEEDNGAGEEEGDNIEGEEDDEKGPGDGPGEDEIMGQVDQTQKPKSERLKEWFKVFAQEDDAERAGVANWARMCIWRYFWDYLFEVSYSDPLENEAVWGRVLPSIHDRHNNIKYICEIVMRRMDKKSRDRVIGQLCSFSDLQGPDIYWDPECRSAGLAHLNQQDDLDNPKTISDNFGYLSIDLNVDSRTPVLGKWHSAEYQQSQNPDEANVPEGADNDNTDILKITLSKEGWEDLKLLTSINIHPRVKKLRAMRQKIRMLHGTKVSVLMKNCIRCNLKRDPEKSACFVDGYLMVNEVSLKVPAAEAFDTDPGFTYKIVKVDKKSIRRCGRLCQGDVREELFESIDSDKFFLSSLLNNAVTPAAAATWEAAIRRRRTCGLSFHFYAGVYSHPDMCKQPYEVCKNAIKKCEGSKSFLYVDLFESNKKVSLALHELYKRMDTICNQNDYAYWFKFWITACKVLFPDSSKVPDSMADFDFVNNTKAICYRMMERAQLEELLRNSHIFDNADLYLSKGNSVGKILDQLYKNLALLKGTGKGNAGAGATSPTSSSSSSSSSNKGDGKDDSSSGKDGKDGKGGRGGNSGSNNDGSSSTSMVAKEFDLYAAQSAKIMAELIEIQRKVAAKEMDTADARVAMAKLAYNNPILLQAAGGAEGIKTLSGDSMMLGGGGGGGGGIGMGTGMGGMASSMTYAGSAAATNVMPMAAAPVVATPPPMPAGLSAAQQQQMQQQFQQQMQQQQQQMQQQMQMQMQQQWQAQQQQMQMQMQMQQQQLAQQQQQQMSAASGSGSGSAAPMAMPVATPAFNGAGLAGNTGFLPQQQQQMAASFQSQSSVNNNSNNNMNGMSNGNNSNSNGASDSSSSSSSRSGRASRASRNKDNSDDEDDSDAVDSGSSGFAGSGTGAGGKKLPKMRDPKMKSRVCTSVAQNGVEGDGQAEDDEDGCSIM